MSIYNQLIKHKGMGQKKLAVLFDPDKMRLDSLEELLARANESGVDFFFVGGSLIVNDMLDPLLSKIKKESNIPIILFPGDMYQLSPKADALLFLSLISGRNADLLIGKQVSSAPYLKKTNLEIISTGYMLIDGGVPTTVQYMSNTTPIPANKTDIATCTAMAGEMLGLKTIYMDAGSGAHTPISTAMINEVSKNINIPLIVGGGIRTPNKIYENLSAGADVVVVGNILESEPALLKDMAAAVRSFDTQTVEK